MAKQNRFIVSFAVRKDKEPVTSVLHTNGQSYPFKCVYDTQTTKVYRMVGCFDCIETARALVIEAAERQAELLGFKGTI